MTYSNFTRRGVLGLGVGAAAAAGLAACGSSGPGSGGSGGSGAATYWYLSGAPAEAIRQGSVDRFNKANPDGKITGTAYANDAYKTKIKTALGAGQGPTIIWGWGGGGLASYVAANQVEDLTDFFSQNAALKAKIFPSSFAAATVNGKIYAMPGETVQPLPLFYNKKLFDQVGVQPPTTWDELMALVPKFNAHGIAPFALGGQSRWTNMMWLEMLLDRIGGPEIFQNVLAGKAGAWSDPAVKDMLTKIQALVDAQGFIKGFSSITADSNADVALLYTGKAAMMLHGSWTYGTMSTDGGDFVSGGHLGWVNFPTVTGGKGDPSNQFGNPGQYMSISSKATDAQKDIAKKFFSTQILSADEIQGWVSTGGVPISTDAQSAIAASKDKDFLGFVYDLASKAKTFSQSWDQALSPAAAEVLLDNIAKLFQKQVTPDQWITNLNAVIGK